MTTKAEALEALGVLTIFDGGLFSEHFETIRDFINFVPELQPIETEADGLYEVSSDGQIRVNGKIKKTHLSDKGYEKVCLFGRTVSVHRLVAGAFCEKEPFHTEVNHKNGDKADNRAQNLEWCTRSENVTHSFRVLNRKVVSICGDKNPNWKRNGNKHPQSMAVQAVFPDGSTKEYESQGLAAADGFRPHKISSCITGARKSHGGARWMPLPTPPITGETK